MSGSVDATGPECGFWPVTGCPGLTVRVLGDGGGPLAPGVTVVVPGRDMPMTVGAVQVLPESGTGPATVSVRVTDTTGELLYRCGGFLVSGARGDVKTVTVAAVLPVTVTSTGRDVGGSLVSPGDVLMPVTRTAAGRFRLWQADVFYEAANRVAVMTLLDDGGTRFRGRPNGRILSVGDQAVRMTNDMVNITGGFRLVEHGGVAVGDVVAVVGARFTGVVVGVHTNGNCRLEVLTVCGRGGITPGDVLGVGNLELQGAVVLAGR